MCRHGTYIEVSVVDKPYPVKVDACIANEIKELNEKGVITLDCCCDHGKAGQPYVIENGFVIAFI